jgi:HK97 family phage major capsid protein
MKKTLLSPVFLTGLSLFALVLGYAAGFQLELDQAALLPALGFAGIGDIQDISKQIENIEKSLEAFQKQAKADIENSGKISTETKNALDTFSEKQREIADRLLSIEQKGSASGDNQPVNQTWGAQFTNSDSYKHFVSGNAKHARFEIQNNTLTGSDVTVAPDRKPGIVPGASQMLTLESFLPTMPTTSNAIEYTREATFVNNAAETAEGLAKPQSDITWALQSMPVSTVAHWIKISRQLAADNAALAAYVNARMVYGVNRRVETQLAVGNGTTPNLSGLFKVGNFTAHGYADAALGSTFKKLVLIRKIIADLKVAGYQADAILLNPADWATIEIELLTTAGMQARVSVDTQGNTRLFGLPVIEAVGVAIDTFLVGSFREACTLHNREGVMVELSESDGTNFTENLVTIRAERRLALCVEVPAAIRGGDLTPA